MRDIRFVAAVVVVTSLATITHAVPANESSGSGDRDCNKLSDAKFTHILVPNDSLSLSCRPKTCPSGCRWFRTWTPKNKLDLYHTGCDLTLEHSQRTDMGYFCCACAGENSYEESCCEGVAYKPDVVRFEAKRNGSRAEVVHVGATVNLTCLVYGYPNLTVELLKDGRKVEGRELNPDKTLYSCNKTIEMVPMTEEDSGVYTCKATITFGQTGKDIPFEAERSLTLVTYRIDIRKVKQEGSLTGNVSFVCFVESTIDDYTVSWLFNDQTPPSDNTIESHSGSEHRLALVHVTSDSVGIYTCVVKTRYRGEEDRKDLKFEIPDPGDSSGRINPHNGKGGGEGGSGDLYTVPGIIIGVAIIFAVVATIISAVFFVYFWRRRNVPSSSLAKGDHRALIEYQATIEPRDSEDYIPVGGVSAGEDEEPPEIILKGLTQSRRRKHHTKL